MKFSEMKYERPDFESTSGRMNALLDELEKAENKETFLGVFERLTKERVHVITMMILAQIRHSINTADEFYDSEITYWDETSPKYEVLEDRMRKICDGVPFKEDLYDVIPETFFKLNSCKMKAFDEKIVPLLVEENRLVTEYGKLKASAQIEFDGKVMNLAEIAGVCECEDREKRKAASKAKYDWYEARESQFDEIYDRLVKVRTEMAHQLGYNDYVDMAYNRMNRLDYDREMVSGYRRQILESVTPLASKLYEKQRVRVGYDRLEYYDLNYQFKDGNPMPKGSADDLVDAAVKMYHEMSPETGAFIDMMKNDELWDLIARPNKEMGGYETEIPEYHSQFIFANFNGTSGDVDVLTHEAGHAFQTFMAKDITIPDVSCPTMESAEIDSMSMEFFAYPWMENFFKEDTAKYKYSHLAGTITFLPYGVLVDHFQEEVYTHPEWSIEERKQCWRKLETMYLPFKNYEECPFLDRGTWWYQQGHIFQSPFYYIDYTLAQVVAQQFFIRMDQNDPTYWEDYKTILKLGGTKSFTQLVSAAHLQVPFEEGCIERIMTYLSGVLDSVDDQAL
ncbi:MAG: M3 family oligoendopeptidase [Bulleidia sp.]